jgi:hypothetical protein
MMLSSDGDGMGIEDGVDRRSAFVMDQSTKFLPISVVVVAATERISDTARNTC